MVFNSAVFGSHFEGSRADLGRNGAEHPCQMSNRLNKQRVNYNFFYRFGFNYLVDLPKIIDL